MNTCTGTTRSGQPCRMTPRRGVPYCINHEPGANTSAIASRAGSARRGPSAHLMEAVLSLTDRASIQAVLDAVVRLTLSGRISEDRARIVLRACTIATHNFDPTGDTLAGPTAQQHDWFPYFNRVQALLATIDPLIDEAAQAEEDTEPGE